jgi:hypothetical protein
MVVEGGTARSFVAAISPDMLTAMSRRVLTPLLVLGESARAVCGRSSPPGLALRRHCDSARIAARSAKGIATTAADERAGVAVGVAAPAGTNC